MSLNDKLNKITNTTPEQNREINKKIFGAFAAVLVLFLIFLYVVAPKKTNTPATNQAPAATLKKGDSLKTSSGIEYSIFKKDTIAQKDYFNIQTSIDKDSDWRPQAKEIITDIVNRNSKKPTSVNIISSDNTDLLNYNMGEATNTIFYTYPIEVNESEIFEIK